MLVLLASCGRGVEQSTVVKTEVTEQRTVVDTVVAHHTVVVVPVDTVTSNSYTYGGVIDSSDIPSQKDHLLPEKIVAFAKAQIGTPYKFGCSKPADGGFDCSGFINYVFDHFSIPVPRSSVEFTNVGTDVPLKSARKGDLILFTGTKPAEDRRVGHIGIVTDNDAGKVSFIHATSGKEYAVTITPLNDHYMVRFVKVIRVYK